MSVLYDSLQEHHSKAFEYLSEALKIDEGSQVTSKKRKALDYYKKGIAELEKGIIIDPKSIPYDKRERAYNLVEKMERNLTMASERAANLERVTLNNTNKARPLSSKSFRTNSEIEAGPSAGIRPSRTPAPCGNLRIGAIKTHSVSPARRQIPQSAQRGKQQKIDDLTNRVKRVKGVDSKLCHLILDQVLDISGSATFDDVAGLDMAKQALHEAVILPAMNPEVFTGLRAPVQGILLFGPPGNGKTMLAKAVAGEAHCNFFNISASALTSKWVGEAEKLVKALFTLAREIQPSIIFIDEVDSILCERSEKDHEVSRRLKTEFLLQFDGVGAGATDRVLVMGATNRPFDLDEAVIRRFPKRIFVGLPDPSTRIILLKKLLKANKSPLADRDLRRVAQLTDGYSGSDLTNLAKDAAMGPVRDVPLGRLKGIQVSQLRPITVADFETSLNKIRASSNPQHLQRLMEFNAQFGEVG